MGILINYPDGTKKYASIGAASVHIEKIVDGPSTENVAKKWQISANVQTWNCASKDETYVHPNRVISSTEVNVQVTEYPQNPHEPIYNEFKKTLYSYEDDN
jgi:hypothetical protein